MLIPLVFILTLCCTKSYIVGFLPGSLTSRLTVKLSAEATEWPGRERKGSTRTTASPVAKKGSKRNKSATTSGTVVPRPSVEQAWQSGYTFSKELKPKKAGGWLRNEPWWMSEDESRNPRLLPIYKPWWSKRYVKVTSALTLTEMKAKAAERDVSVTGGKKAELLAKLQQQEAMYALTDDNFTPPVFISGVGKDLGACYPDVYEKNDLPVAPV